MYFSLLRFARCASGTRPHCSTMRLRLALRRGSNDGSRRVGISYRHRALQGFVDVGLGRKIELQVRRRKLRSIPYQANISRRSQR